MVTQREFERELETRLAEERQRLAQDLHDTVSQSLTAIYFRTKYLERKLERCGSGASGDFSELGESIHGAVQELHGIMNRLLADGNAVLGSTGDQPHPGSNRGQ